jgi:hypothetical protein
MTRSQIDTELANLVFPSTVLYDTTATLAVIDSTLDSFSEASLDFVSHVGCTSTYIFLYMADESKQIKFYDSNMLIDYNSVYANGTDIYTMAASIFGDPE